MQSVSSRIWTRVAVSISNDDNHYTTGKKQVWYSTWDRGVSLPNECPGYNTKQSDGQAPWMLELWGMQSTPLLPLLSGSLWLGVVTPDGICSPSYQPDECGTRPFLRWVRAQGRSPHAPGISKNASDLVGIGFIALSGRAINLTSPKRVKAWRDGPLRPEVYPVTRHTRPELPITSRPAECVPSTGYVASRKGRKTIGSNPWVK